MVLERFSYLFIAILLGTLFACSKNEKEGELPQQNRKVPIAEISNQGFELRYEDDPEMYWGFFTSSYSGADPQSLSLDLSNEWGVKVISDPSEAEKNPTPVGNKYYLTAFAYDYELDRPVFLRLGLEKMGENLVLEQRTQNYLEFYYCEDCQNGGGSTLEWDESWHNVKCVAKSPGDICLRTQKTYGDHAFISSNQ